MPGFGSMEVIHNFGKIALVCWKSEWSGFKREHKVRMEPNEFFKETEVVQYLGGECET